MANLAVMIGATEFRFRLPYDKAKLADDADACTEFKKNDKIKDCKEMKNVQDHFCSFM